MSYEISLPLSLLDTIQSAFEKEAKTLCGQVADTLGIPRQLAIQRVFSKAPKVQLTVFELETPKECPILLQKGPIHTRCRKHTLLGTDRCLEHQVTCHEEPEIKNEFSLLLYGDLKFWVETKTGFVYTSCGSIVGDYRGGVFTKYSFE